MELPPLSLYIHIPWCVKKCPYCDFNSHTSHQPLPEKAYTDALIADLEQDQHYVQNRPIHSVFFGGGTPSLFSAESISRILQHLFTHFNMESNCEITLEANPGTIDSANFQGYRQAGVNRLSIGVQSFADTALQKLGRIHSASQASLTFEKAREARFTNINIDIMFGLAEQTNEAAMFDLKQAIALQPEQISWYQLTIEPNTYFYKHTPLLPADDAIAVMQSEGQRLLARHGFQHYEISAYAKSHFQSQHNLNYWRFGDYLGIGAGAHSKITLKNSGEILRQWKHKMPQDYLDLHKKFTSGSSIINRKDVALEFMLNALRLTEGVDYQLFEKRTGLDIESIAQQLDLAQSKQLLKPHRLQATPLGLQFLNDLLQLFS